MTKRNKPNSSQGRSEALLFNQETFTIHSNSMDEDFKIYISFPVDYFQTKNSAQSYPVLYCTDGNRAFNLISDIVNMLSFPKTEIPRIVVVGIGYGIKGLEDWVAGRLRDLTPTNNPEEDTNWQKILFQISGRNDIITKSGGASKFLGFLCNELIPFVESNYRVKKNDRALIGYSYGGLFTLFSMFQNPEIFQRYYAGSPSIEWDDQVLFQYEKKFAETHKDLPVSLFMSYGSLEIESEIANMYEMASRLKERNYPGLKLKMHLFENETHVSCCAAGISRALRVIYEY